MTWKKLSSVIEQNTSFLISSHMSPDGDCIGSQLALYWYLKHRSKEVAIYNVDPVPRKLSFLHDASAISCARPERRFDVIIVLDSSNPDRLGWEGNGSIADYVVNIDHHEDNAQFADVNIIDSSSAATGQILFRFFETVGAKYPAHVAQALYTAIMTDTGGFRFSNTSSAVLRVCAELADRGADCSEAYRRVYACDSPPGLMLKSRIWSTLSFANDNRICFMEMPQQLVGELGAEYGDSEGMADFTITADGVEVGILIKYDPDRTHFSLRSAGRIDVGRIARSIKGGGGHTNAAGCTLNMPLEEAKLRMFDILGRELAAL